MRERVRARLVAIGRRVRRIERRELAEFSRWVENTDNLIHLTILLFVPLLIAFVTQITNMTNLSFLLFPPLASGTYTLFADPRGKYASPRKFVVGLTVGALCGWGAQEVTTAAFGTPGQQFVSPLGAALSIFLVGAATWGLDVEEPAAFSTALLVLVAETGRSIHVLGLGVVSQSAAYVLGVTVSGSIIAVAFTVWREMFYEERANYLYGTTRGDDHVLVPMRGDSARRTALFGARLAAAHEAGKVVLLDIVDDERLAAAERAILSGERAPPDVADIEYEMAEREGPDVARLHDAENVEEAVVDRVQDQTARRAAAEAASTLERHASTIRTKVGVPCEVVVAAGDPGRTTLDTARATNCDLIVTPYEEDHGSLSSFIRTVFRGPYDAITFRSTTETERWRRILVTVSRPGDSAHAMIDFATRLAKRGGNVSVCTCISDEAERRRAETRLANLVETATGPIETRVARTDIQSFIESNADGYDLVVMGSSGDRSAASRFISPPTFERIRTVDCDIAVVDRGQP